MQTDTSKISTSNNEPAQFYSHVISTLPAHQLSRIVNIPELALIPYSTVMVVNLYYTTPHLVPEPGFGYLIPQSAPFAQNPEFGLGVVFDSYGTPDLDGSVGTKLTVMLGGHYWNGLNAEELPTTEEGKLMAERVVERHLRITEKPDRVMATLQKDCIPQYTVGHDQRLKSIHWRIKSQFGDRLSVAGAWTGGVGVNDCVVSGNLAAMTLGEGLTGLEDVLAPKKWVRLSYNGTMKPIP